MRTVAVALGLCFAACSTSPFEQSQDDLANAQARWRSAAMSDYAYHFQRACFCAPPATRAVAVTVHQGAWATLAYVDDGTAADTSLFRDFLTMDRIFSYLGTTLEQHPSAFDATYDAHLGYPVDAYIDHAANIADDEFSFQITAVQ